MILQYDTARMKELLSSFYQLTKIRIVVFDDAFQKVMEIPDHDCAFCSLIRRDAAAQEKCTASDRQGFAECKKRNSMYSYTCHAGLTETVAPIRYGDLVIGYLMFGQVLQQPDKAAYWQEVETRCAGYRVERDELRAAYLKKRPVSLEQVYASSLILEACAGFLWLQRTISLKEDGLPNRIHAYIQRNLGADLSAQVLCRQFSISRSKLYAIAREYYGCGIERLTRSLRVKRARELLETTGLPVSQVSQNVGYPDYNYFIKVFKKECGITPAKFRKQHNQVDRQK